MTADRELLSRFLADRDEGSFAELVRRHGPGVWGACRRRLRNPADAEDAFQAAFLVLVRRANRLRAGTPLGPWLGKVAALTARNVARGNRRRAAVSGPMEHDVAAAGPADVPVDLDAALLGLPEADRAAVTLCHLDGLSRREAAERLGCPEGTLSARLSRALGKLRERLADEVPPGLVRSTVRVAVVVGVTAGSAGVSPAVAKLTEEAIRMLWVKKLTAAGLVLAAAGMIGVGVVNTAGAGGQEPAGKATAKADPPAAVPGADLEKRVRELEEALKEAQAENFRLRLQGERVTKFLGEQLSRVGGERADPPAAKPDPPPVAPKLDPPADLVAELQKRLDAAEAAKKYQQDLADKLRDELAQARRARADPKKAAADLTLVILGDENAGWAARYQLTERADGKEVFYLTPSAEGLAKLLTRAKADPKGPKTVQVEVEPACPQKHLLAAFDAFKAAGFKTVQYKGPLEGDLLGTAKGPGAWTYDKAKRYEGPIDLADLPKGPPAGPKQ